MRKYVGQVGLQSIEVDGLAASARDTTD